MKSTIWRRKAMCRLSFETPEHTLNSDAFPRPLRLLEAIRILKLEKKDPLLPGLHFGNVRPESEKNCRETTPFYPRSPYGAAKVYGSLDHGELSRGLRHPRLQRHHIQSRMPDPRRNLCHPQNYTHDCHAIQPRHPEDCLYLGNMDSVRDWGHARDYVIGMWKMLQQPKPDDYRGGHGRNR